MIQSKQELRLYLEADRIAFGKPKNETFRQRTVARVFPDLNYEYVKVLRRLEYYLNTKPHHFYTYVLQKRLGRLRHKTGIELSPNVAGPGIHLSHGKVVVSSVAKIGSNCKILSDVTIGGQGRYDYPGAPVIGDRVFIGSGAKIIGNIHIPDDCVIGANSVVTKSIDEAGITVAGNPARKVSDNNSYHFLNRD